MHVYVMDALLRPTKVIDTFQSMIWTERFQEKGDFELSIYPSADARSAFPPGQLLGTNVSSRLMIVENIEERIDDDGRGIMTVKGSSLESVFENRIVRQNIQSNATQYTGWTYKNMKIVDIMYDVVKRICIDGQLSQYDKIPNLTNQVQNDRSTEPPDSISITFDEMTMYEFLVNLCQTYDLGFRVTAAATYSTSTLYFTIYNGSDRTSSQTTNPAVIFAPQFENLRNTRKLTTIGTSKNCAYVISDYGTATVYPADVSPDMSGFDRRVLLVHTQDVQPDDPDIPGTLNLIGRRELAKYRSLGGFDGEISQRSQFLYNKDYFLGDLVEVRGSDGAGTQMRVTEQIFVSDEQGIRSYPTLLAKTFVNPGGWAAWPASQHWIDLDPSTLAWGGVTP